MGQTLSEPVIDKVSNASRLHILHHASKSRRRPAAKPAGCVCLYLDLKTKRSLR